MFASANLHKLLLNNKFEFGVFDLLLLSSKLLITWLLGCAIVAGV